MIMAQLIVNVNRLNRRSKIPTAFPEPLNIIGTVQKGFRFESMEETTNALGKWYKDRDQSFYWSGGLTVLDAPPTISIKIKDLPINLPAEYKAGIDISHHNGTPDWAAIKTAGVSFVYLKISEGVNTPDDRAKQNAAMAKQLGFKIGYYHFAHPDTHSGGSIEKDAENEAKDALDRMAAIGASDLPLALDLENENMPLSSANFLLWIETFINRAVQATGKEPMIYGAKAYLDSHLPASHPLGKYKLWMPRYEMNDAQKLRCPVGWADWAMWQYTEHGKIGNSGDLDVNILKDQSLF